MENKLLRICQSVYSFFTIIYLLFLNNLNKILNENYGKVNIINAFKIVSYNEYQPLKYFICAVMLLFFNILLIIKLLRECSEGSENIIEYIIYIFINVVFIVLIVTFINNPIFRAIMLVMLFGGVIAVSYSS